MNPLSSLLAALDFAARKHSKHRRKDADRTPYVNHLIEVADMLARAGVDDLATLLAAVLHDTVEDTATTLAELEQRFGAEVAALVAELSDDKSLPSDERKRLQVEHAAHKSAKARLVKIADKASNVKAMVTAPPHTWSWERRMEYLDWSDRVVAPMRGANAELEAEYDHWMAASRLALNHEKNS